MRSLYRYTVRGTDVRRIADACAYVDGQPASLVPVYRVPVRGIQIPVRYTAVRYRYDIMTCYGNDAYAMAMYNDMIFHIMPWCGI